ncbi:MAG: aminotransferase class V-fold PLP-dependent enzyme [Treponema sp.]
MIYFDNSATTLQKPETVAQAVYETIASQHYANPGRAAHTTAHNALAQLFKTRSALARIFGVQNPLQIALCQNATAALNLVLKSLFGAGDHLITTALEHNSVLRPLYQLERQGAEVSIIGFDLQTGVLDYKEMAAQIRDTTKAIVVSACSNVIGAVCDIETVHNLCAQHGLILIIDASQSAGIIPFNLSEYSNTIVCFTGHKGLYGPQGTGGIAVNGNFDFKPVFSGGSGIHSFDQEHPATMPDVFESGTMNVPSFAGLAAGCAYLEQHGISTIGSYLSRLRTYFIERILTLPHITLYAPEARTAGPVIGINIGTIPSGEVSRLLDEQYGIATRPGAHCAPLVHRAYNTESQGIVRFSFSSFNTKAEIDCAVSALETIGRILE